MDFLQPTRWADALAIKATQPAAIPIAGGTDLMVGLNAGMPAPVALLDMFRIRELSDWWIDGDVVHIGAGVTCARVVSEVGGRVPALAAACRTVGSAQIRNRATVAGNLGTASPAGDALPALLAGGAVVRVESVRGARAIPIDEFFVGPKRNSLAADELIRSVAVPVATGPHRFAKVGERAAMVIAVCSLAMSVDPVRRRVGVGIGSAASTPVRAATAQVYAEQWLPWAGGVTAPDPQLLARFGALVAEAAAPIDDVRATAAYRRHALSVLGRRLLRGVWTELSAG